MIMNEHNCLILAVFAGGMVVVVISSIYYNNYDDDNEADDDSRNKLNRITGNTARGLDAAM